MRLPRLLSALLIAALLLSSAPASVLAAANATTREQAPSDAGISTYLLSVTPPVVTVPPQAEPFDAAGFVNIEHERHYADVQAQLDALQAQGAISGYSAQPAAYAFVISAPDAQALAALGTLGRLQAQGDMSAAAVDELAASYSRELNAAIAGSVRQAPTQPAAPAQPPALLPPLPQEKAMPSAVQMEAEGVAAAVTPKFTVYLNDNYVFGGGFTTSIPVTLTLKSVDGVVKGTDAGVTEWDAFINSYYVYLFPKDVYGNEAKIVAGDVVEVQTPGLITIPVMDLLAIPNAAAGQITGRGPANITSTVSSILPNLYVEPGGYVTTTAAGDFAVSSPYLQPGDYWRMEYTSAQGHRIDLRYGVPVLAARGYIAPWYSTYTNDAYVSGSAVAINTPVTVTLTHPSSAPIVNFAVSDEYGRFWLYLLDQYANPVNIVPGDSLQFSDGLVTRALTVPTFSVTSDPGADTLSGTTDATVVTDTVRLPQTLSLWPTSWDEDDYGRTVPAPGGSFSAANPFYYEANPANGSAVLDWSAGQAGHLRYLDTEGDAVFQSFRAPSPAPILQLRTYYGSSYVQNAVSGFVSGPCPMVGTVTLRDAANAVKDQNMVSACSSFSTEFQDAYSNPLPILAGDSVEATFNGSTTKVTAPNWSMSANVKTDVVSGQIDAGLVTTTTYGAPRSLAIYAVAYNYTFYSQNVQPDAAGKFSADFSTMRDILPGDEGVGVYTDAKGNSIFGLWEAPAAKPVLSLRGSGGYYADNYISISLADNTCTWEQMQVVVKASDGAMRWEDLLSFCWSAGLWLYDDFGSKIELAAGDVVQATYAGQTVSVTVPRFDNLVSDPETDTVAGITNASVTTTTVGLPRTLAVWPTATDDYYYGKQVAVAAGGVFSATNPFYWEANPAGGSATLDWEAGQRGHLRYIDANGNRVYAAFTAKTDRPVLSIYKGGNEVSGMLPSAGTPVTVALMSGATVKGMAYDTSNEYGEFGVKLFDGAGNPLEIAENDQVVLADPAVTVNVPRLTAAVDTDNELVSGQGPTNSLLNVSQPESPLEPPRSTLTDAAGNYQADFRGRADLTLNTLVKVQHQNGDGHTVWIERLGGAMLSAALNSGRVWGYAPVDQDIAIGITVKRGGAVIGATSLSDWGYFSAFPVDANGKPIVLAAGDVVEMDFGSGVVRTLTLAPLTMVVNGETNALGGSGPANSRLAVVMNSYPQIYDDTVTTDAAGKWAVDLNTKGSDIKAGDMASLRYSPDGIDTTWLYGIAPVFYVRQSGDNSVRGYTDPYVPVTITLKRDGVNLAVAYRTALGNGYFDASLRDVNGLTANILAGDVVEVKGLQTVSVTVPVLQVIMDIGARTVSGIGPANTSLGIVTNAGSKTVKTDGKGTFSAVFTSYLYSARVDYREPGGNWIMTNATQQVGGTPRLMARWDDDAYEYRSNAISGSTGAGPRTVTLTLRRGSKVLASAITGAGWSGYFNTSFLDSANQPVPIAAGDVIEMVSGDVKKSMTVPALTVQTNLESGTLFGTGPANAPLNTDWWCDNGTIDPTGAWVVECEDDLGPGDDGHIYVTDLTGNRTYLGWSIPGIWVRQNSNYVYGTVTLGADVQVQLQRGAGVVAAASAKADPSNGWFRAEFFTDGGSPAIIQPGDVVAVNAGQMISVPVGPLSAAVDTAADKVTGSGPANQELAVSATVNGDTVVRRLTTAADGSYTADFSGALNLRSGAAIEVRYVNAEGHVVWMAWSAPLVRINLASDIVDGYATPNATAALALKRGGSVVATAEAQTSLYGFFSAFFLDGSGSVIDLVAGDVVEVTASPTVAAAAIALTANLNAATDKVTGSATPGAALLVIAFNCASGCYSSQMTAIAGADGSYTADFSGSIDLDQTSYAHVQATDAEGNQTSISTLPAEAPRRELAENDVLAAGGVLVMSAYGTANGGNLTPPQTFSVTGGGRLIFAAHGGSLVVTAPDGTVTRPDSTYYVVTNPRTGVWKVQVEAWGSLGDQYAVAAGLAQYSIYMPAIQRQ